jgi:hypothetical protein
VRLLLRDFIATLRERDELDRIIQQMLPEQGFRILKRPSRGQLEHGVDIAARRDVGGRPHLYLIQVKCGDVDRRSWDSGPNSIRPSLNAILDNRLRLKRELLPEAAQIIVLLVHNGTMVDNVASDFEGFTSRPTKGVARIERWDLERIADELFKHFFRPELLGANDASLLRRTIAFLENPGYDLKHFRKLIVENLAGLTGRWASDRKRLKRLDIASTLIEHYSQGELGNLALSQKAYELHLLHIFTVMYKKGLLKRKNYQGHLGSLLGRYLSGSLALLVKINPLLDVPFGLALSGLWEGFEYPSRCLGLAALASQQYLLACALKDSAEGQSAAEGCLGVLIRVIRGNPGIFRPAFDHQITDIAIIVLALIKANRSSDAITLVEQVVGRMAQRFRLKRILPEGSSNIRAVARYHITGTRTEEYVSESSTLIPCAAELAVILGSDETYQFIVNEFGQGKINLQQAYTSKDRLLEFCGVENVSEREVAETSIVLPLSSTEFREQIIERSQFDQSLRLEFETEPLLELVLMVFCRYTGTRLPPVFWRRLLPEVANRENASQS